MSSYDFDGEIDSVTELQTLINENPGLLVVKMGATWCGPCKKIKEISHEKMSGLSDTWGNSVNIIEIDIDDSFEVYASLKTKRIVNGIPAILCWFKGNTELRPDEFINDSDPNGVALLFERCDAYLKSM
jgi:thiol-disulfide isomerase/thioredoxin